jgi:hypothetical protein
MTTKPNDDAASSVCTTVRTSGALTAMTVERHGKLGLLLGDDQ